MVTSTLAKKSRLHYGGRMHDADVSASLRLKLTYDGLAHYVGMQNDVLALVRVLRPVVA